MLDGLRIVIVGGGIAGYSAASAVRRYADGAHILLVSKEKYTLYSPCAFYKVLSGELPKHKLFLRHLSDYGREAVSVLHGHEALSIDVSNQQVIVDSEVISYDKLILALGSKSVMLPLGGADKRGVFCLKTMSDLEAIIGWSGKRIVVVGSGPIGIETAVAFRKRGLKVTVLEVLPHLLPRLFDAEAASLIKGILENRGITIYTDERATQILGGERVEGLKTDKREIECDTVIVAAGVKPNTDLAKKAGLVVGSLGGIIVDDYMRTNIENIYACGDCVEAKSFLTGERCLSPLWHNAKRQGWVAGCTAVGHSKKFNGSIDATIMDIFGHYVLSIGKTAASFAGPCDFYVSEHKYETGYERLIIADGKLVGVQLVNRIGYAGQLCATIWRNYDINLLAKLVRDPKLLSQRPWHSWAKRYVVDLTYTNHDKSEKEGRV